MDSVFASIMIKTNINTNSRAVNGTKIVPMSIKTFDGSMPLNFWKVAIVTSTIDAIVIRAVNIFTILNRSLHFILNILMFGQ